MTTTTATELKNRLGAYLDAARTEPVFIQKSGRDVAVLISREHYSYLQRLEDHWWGEQAKLAEADGMLGVEETARALKALEPPEDETTCYNSR
jgi:prevent-host-death family protein